MTRPRTRRGWGRLAIFAAAAVLLTVILGISLVAHAEFILGRLGVAVGGGALLVSVHGTPPGAAWAAGWDLDPRSFRPWFAWERWTFYSPYGASPGTTLVIPLWCPWLLLAGLTWLAWRRSRRPGPGRCPACRYDLTALPPGPCPECGRGRDAPAP